jgi:hypothetical protein
MSGCGGSGDASTEAALTKKQFISMASKACEKAEGEELRGVVAYKETNPSSEEGDVVKPIFVPALEKQAQQINALQPPPVDKKTVQAMMQKFEKALTATRQNPSALIKPGTNPFRDYDRMAKQYGLVKCGYVP